MQLDKTEIEIRERGLLELLDLSLLVFKSNFARLLMTSALLGVPLLALDVLLVAWMVDGDSMLVSLDQTSSSAAAHWRHGWHLVALWSLQYPLASLPATVFLGNKMFFEHLTFPSLLDSLRPIAWRSILVLGVIRLGLLGIALEFCLNRSMLFEPQWEVLVLGFMLFGPAMLIRAFWPFAPEILGLEKLKLRAKQGTELSYARRSRWLHQALQGENFARFVICAAATVCMALMVLSLQLFLMGVTSGRWYWNVWFDHLLLPITLWFAGVFVTVFRFLAYLDSRIRLEGWAIELQLRAEASRQEASLAPPTLQSTLEIMQ